MPSQITLDANDNAKVENAIPTYSTSNDICYSAHARIYYAYAGTKKWSYSGLQGALTFVLNASSNMPHFKMVDLEGTRGVIWGYELHDGVGLEQEKNVPFFLSFESDFGGEKRSIGFVFLDDSDAQIFYNHVKIHKGTKSVPAKPNWSSWMKSISKGGNNIEKSMIFHPNKGGFVNVAHMGYDADSGFGSKGVDPLWNAILENYSEGQQNQPVVASRSRTLPPPSSAVHRSKTLPSSRHAARAKPPTVAHHIISPGVEEQLPLPPPRRSTPLIDGLPPLPVRFPPQPPREMVTNLVSTGLYDSRPRYSESPPSPVVLSHSISRNTSISPAIVPSRYGSSTNGAATLIQQQESHRSQRPPIYETVDRDDGGSLTPDANQTVQLPFQSSQHCTAPWVLASRPPHAPKKPLDIEFMMHMADIRRQTNDPDASSTSSASLILPRVSVTSSAFSQSLSITSAPRVVDFPPTPVFKDEVPGEIMRKVKSPPPYSSASHAYVNRS